MLDLLRRHAADCPGDLALRWQANHTTQLMMRKGTLLQNNSTSSGGVSARCYRDGIFGFASLPGHDPDAIALAIRRATENAALFGRPAPRPASRLPETAPGLGQFDYRTARPRLAPTERIDLLRRIDAYITERYPGLVNADISLGAIAMEKALVTSTGAETYSYVPRTTLIVNLSLQANDSVVELYDVLGGFGDVEDQLVSLAPVFEKIDALYDALRRKAEGTDCTAGLHDVILDSAVAGILAHEAIGHTCEGDSVLAGSVAGDHVGEPVAAEKITLVDYAGRGPDGKASIAIHVDDEGTPCRDVTIIERGILKEFLHSKETALKLGAEPTGNARAFAFSDEPLVRMRNTAIAPGTDKLADMIASIDRGYYLQRSTNGQADATGEFMFGIACGYEIRNGKLGRAIRDTTISGVAFDMLKTVTHVGDDLHWSEGGWCGKKQWIPVGMGGPAIKCKITVGGR